MSHFPLTYDNMNILNQRPANLIQQGFDIRTSTMTEKEFSRKVRVTQCWEPCEVVLLNSCPQKTHLNTCLSLRTGCVETTRIAILTPPPGPGEVQTKSGQLKIRYSCRLLQIATSFFFFLMKTTNSQQQQNYKGGIIYNGNKLKGWAGEMVQWGKALDV